MNGIYTWNEGEMCVRKNGGGGQSCLLEEIKKSLPEYRHVSIGRKELTSTKMHEISVWYFTNGNLCITTVFADLIHSLQVGNRNEEEEEENS